MEFGVDLLSLVGQGNTNLRGVSRACLAAFDQTTIFIHIKNRGGDVALNQHFPAFQNIASRCPELTSFAMEEDGIRLATRILQVGNPIACMDPKRKSFYSGRTITENAHSCLQEQQPFAARLQRLCVYWKKSSPDEATLVALEQAVAVCVRLSGIVLRAPYYDGEIGRTLAAIGGTSMLQNLTKLTIEGELRGSAPQLASALERMPVLSYIKLIAWMDGPAALAIAAHASPALRELDTLLSWYPKADDEEEDDANALVDHATMLNTVGPQFTKLFVKNYFWDIRFESFSSLVELGLYDARGSFVCSGDFFDRIALLTGLTRLDIRSTDVDISQAVPAVRALTRLTSLSFMAMTNDVDDWLSFGAALGGLSALQNLTFRACDLSRECFIPIARAFVRLDALTHFTLNDNDDGDYFCMMLLILQKQLRVVDLSGLDVSLKGLREIIPQMTKLEDLTITCDGFDEFREELLEANRTLCIRDGGPRLRGGGSMDWDWYE